MVANSPSIARKHPAAPPRAATPPERGHPGRALGAALGYLLVLAATAVVFVGTAAGQRLDGRLVTRAYWDAAGTGRGRLIEPSLNLLYLLEDPMVLGVLVVAVLLIGVLNRRAWAGIAGIAALLGTVGGSVLLKVAIPRPDLAVAGSTAHNSFPSGHVAVATGLLLAFMLALPGRARWWLAPPGALVVSAVGAAAMIAGWHRFSDLVGGVALASASCCLAAALLGAVQRGTTRLGTSQPPATRSGAALPHAAPGRTCPTRATRAGTGWLAPALLVAVVGTAAVSAAAAALPVDAGLALAVVAAGVFTVLSTAVTAAVLSVTRL